MENRFTLRRGDTPPSTENLMEYELGWDKQGKRLYMNDGGESVSLMMHEDEIQQMIDSSIQEQVLASFFDWVYPVGSLYWSMNNTDPSTLFCGTTWEQIVGRFVYAIGSDGDSGTLAGSKEVELYVDNLPAHTHAIDITVQNQSQQYINGTTSSDGDHEHRAPDGGSSVGLRSFVTCNYDYNSFSRTIVDAGDLNKVISAPDSGIAAAGYYTQSAGYHSHSFNGTVPSHGHTATGDISETGESKPFSIMPPYVTAYCWKRIS